MVFAIIAAFITGETIMSNKEKNKEIYSRIVDGDSQLDDFISLPESILREVAASELYQEFGLGDLLVNKDEFSKLSVLDKLKTTEVTLVENCYCDRIYFTDSSIVLME